MTVNKAQKNIFCLESLWDNKLEKKLSVLPLLELAERTCSLEFIHLTCNTTAELEFNLGLSPKRKSYGLLYLAFHGSVGSIQLYNGESIDFNRLAKMMGQRYEGWVVHIGSCNTLNAKESEIREFIKQTGIKVVTGYVKTVDWVDSAALDLIIFRWWQDYQNPRSFLKFIESTYSNLVEINGFEYVI